MSPIFEAYKKLIDDFLLEFLESKKQTLQLVNDFGPDLIERVKKLIVAGKTIRGSLVLLAFRFTKSKISPSALKAAAAMELFQTALLVHDDVMDHDDVRRGLPTLHKQYKSEEVALAAGDALFFMGFELLGQLETDALTLGRIVRLVGREYQAVGVAQMADVAKTAKTKQDIFSLYTHKTARYTFALPLMLGTTLAGTTKEMLRYLESYGASVGVLFQIKDDELDKQSNLFTTSDIAALQESANESIKRLPIETKDKKILIDLLAFVSQRTK